VLWDSTASLVAPFVKQFGFCEWGVLYKSQLLLLFMLFVYWSHFSVLGDEKKISQQIHFVYISFHFNKSPLPKYLNTTPSSKPPHFRWLVETLSHSYTWVYIALLKHHVRVLTIKGLLPAVRVLLMLKERRSDRSAQLKVASRLVYM